jgi:hypothetical protein
MLTAVFYNTNHSHHHSVLIHEFSNLKKYIQIVLFSIEQALMACTISVISVLWQGRFEKASNIHRCHT